MTKKIAEEILSNIRREEGYPYSVKGALLLFDEDWYASPFIDCFGIVDDKEKFNKAFKIVTGGVGNELAKIDSAISSSLLSLLFFYQLFGKPDKSDKKITIEGITYNQVFFEVRNKCIGFPSCVDVVLLSEDRDKDNNPYTLLFLESKFTEYIGGVSKKETYGKSYNVLYEKLKGILNNNGIEVGNNDKQELVLKSSQQEKLYIEGIKQSISHLIGLVNGPQVVEEKKCGSYYDEYKEYREAFKKAKELIYGTIIFDIEKLKSEFKDEFNYKDLYSGIIGKNGKTIVETIVETETNRSHNKKIDVKKIEVLEKPLTYQDVFGDEKNKNYLSNLPERIKKYYGFDKL